MMRILFICHGNICRSPMAEFVFRDMVRKQGLADNFEIASAAVSSEEEGNSVYPPVKRLLNAAGIDCSGKTARKMTRADYEYYDLLLAMDHSNLRNMSQICGGDPEQKMHLLLEYAGRNDREVADPWYTGNFDLTWRDINDACAGLLQDLI